MRTDVGSAKSLASHDYFKKILDCLREWKSSCRAIGSYLDIQPYKSEVSTSQKSVPDLDANLGGMWFMN